MNPHTFLRTLLLLPILLPLLAIALDSKSFIGFQLIMSLLVGGVPYLVTAALLWLRIGRCTSQKSAMVQIFVAPLVFAPLLAVFFVLRSLVMSPEADSTEYLAVVLASLGLSVSGLILGYLYASCAAILFLLVTRLGLVSRFARVEPCSTSEKAA